MKARQSKRAIKFFKNEKNGRKILQELRDNDKLDGEPIHTSFGNAIKGQYFHKIKLKMKKLIVTKNFNTSPFGQVQLRWKEPMGKPECPYLYRWTLILFGYTIRLHHWLRSDDNRHFHDHACDLISIIILS